MSKDAVMTTIAVVAWTIVFFSVGVFGMLWFLYLVLTG